MEGKLHDVITQLGTSQKKLLHFWRCSVDWQNVQLLLVQSC
jgi:hypothetical protein